MEFFAGAVARSKAGHDKGTDYIVLASESGYCFVADGRLKKTDKPKKKKHMHLQVSGYTDENIAKKLAAGVTPENYEVRRALAEYRKRIAD